MAASPPARADRSGSGHGSSPVARRGLFERLSAGSPAGVTLVSAPAGSGKTVLLRSWVDDSGLADRVAWLTVERDQRDPQRFWLAAVEKLRAAVGADAFIEKLSPAPDFDGHALVERLVSELGSLEDPAVLVIDDLHELHAPEALAQLGFLLDRRPSLLGVVLATRRDPQFGLHRLRLAGELTEVRATDLRFTLDETRELLAASGITPSDEAIAMLHTRTEGWAAGLRLAALSLAGHPDPERFLAEFSGSERAVADYLLAEVLERQTDEVRQVLLRTSILDRVCGALADALTGVSGSERILLELEEANAFVVSVDPGRSWFRYHQLFADLLRLELRRTDPSAVVGLHRAAAAWLEEHGHIVEAVKHAQAAEDWSYAARLVADQSFSLSLDGQEATVHTLLAAFPEDARSDPELARAFASDQLTYGSLDSAATYLSLAERHASEVLDERRHRFDVALGVARLSLARRQGDYGSVLDEVEPLLAPAVAETASEIKLGDDAKAVALMNLGIIELWSIRSAEAQRHLQQGLELARRIGRPYVQIACLAYLALAGGRRSFVRERERCLEAVAIAEAHGWEAEPSVCIASAAMGAAAVLEGRFGEAQYWLDRAERALRPDLDPATALLVHLARGLQHVGEGRLSQALVALRAAEQCQAELLTAHVLTVETRHLLMDTQLRLGDMAAARATVARFSNEDREWGEAQAASAALHLAEGDARAAVDVLAPVLAGHAPVVLEYSAVHVLLLEAIARDLLGEPRAAEAAIERALDLAEPDGNIFPFVLTPARELLERHPRHRTAHAALLSDILDVLGGSAPPLRSAERPTLETDLTE
ncbi:MAG: AAA family ATPase, partial [Gaiellaceae bacterium]